MSKNPVPPSLSDIDVRIDARGVEHHRARPDPRIVSLVPSLTELLCDLGVGSQIVGCTRFCIHPRETVRRIEKVGGTKDVDIEKIRALAPTHVIVN
ncbi:MAG TPA: helical backbone metal receptor, partial [Gammaproteobacteria bacterium]|nr:helical backbone metal receptor [Gammaproteobacteria bacterium]